MQFLCFLIKLEIDRTMTLPGRISKIKGVNFYLTPPNPIIHKNAHRQSPKIQHTTTYLTQVKKSNFGQFSSSWAMEEESKRENGQDLYKLFCQIFQICGCKLFHLVVAEQSWWFIAACSLLSQCMALERSFIRIIIMC